MKQLILCLAFIASFNASAGLIFVDSWHVGDGPRWSADLPDYQDAFSGQEAAAFLFGGDASDYVISTVSALVADIDYSAWYDTYNGGLAVFAHDYSTGPLYSPGLSSAYILDHSCGDRYSDINLTCPDSDQYVNYAFRVTDVPEPTALALLGLGLAGLGFTRRMKNA